MEFFIHGGYSHPDRYREIAKAADAAGIDGMLVPDHVFIPKQLKAPYPYTPDGRLPMPDDVAWPDPWVLIAAVGEAAPHLTFQTNVYILALRNPIFVARSAGTAAITTGGRILMGVGVGWMKDEYDALGSHFTKRGIITDRSIEILRRLWRDGEMDAYKDEFFDIPALLMLPKPDSPPPILIGGESSAALDRAARIGDGYVSTPHDADSHFRVRAEINERLERAGRDPATFQYRAGLPLPNAGYDDCARLAEAGFTGISVRLWPTDVQELAAQTDAIEEFVERVVKPVRAQFG